MTINELRRFIEGHMIMDGDQIENYQVWIEDVRFARTKNGQLLTNVGANNRDYLSTSGDIEIDHENQRLLINQG